MVSIINNLSIPRLYGIYTCSKIQQVTIGFAKEQRQENIQGLFFKFNNRVST